MVNIESEEEKMKKLLFGIFVLSMLILSACELQEETKTLKQELEAIPTVTNREVLNECEEYMRLRPSYGAEMELELELNCLYKYAREVDKEQGCKLLEIERKKFTYYLWDMGIAETHPMINDLNVIDTIINTNINEHNILNI